MALVASAAGCGKRPPAGALGARWNEPVAKVADRLGVQCKSERGDPYQMCRGGTLRVFGRAAAVALIGQDGRLVGVSLDFRGDCDYRELQRRVADHFHVEYSAGETGSPYTTWSSGEVIHFRQCVLTVGNAEYGEYFVGNLIGAGFRDLGGAMTPH